VAKTGTTTASTTSASTTSTQTTTAKFSLTFDGARDLTAFTYGTASGVLLSSHVSAYDLSRAGGIQGQLTLTNLTGLSSANNGTPGLEASAQVLSADGTRHVVVARAPVASDGSFTLYPLAASSSNNTSYDLVIHGPGIATIIIKSVLVPATSSSASTTGTTTSGTTTNPDTAPITPSDLVSVGTLVPRAAAPYSTNITTAAGAPLPAGAEVAFYQTLPSSGEVPYVIEATPIDPFNQVLAHAQLLSSGTVDSGTYVSSGATITVVSAKPKEDAAAPVNTTAAYQVAASAPLYADGQLGVLVAVPTTAGVTTAGPVTVGTLALAPGSSAASVSASVHLASASKYDRGELMLSQNGQLIASAPLDAAIAGGGGTVQIAAVPGGMPTSVYYVSVRAWCSGAAGANCSGDPAGSLTRQWYPHAVDLRSASSANVEVTIN
jgi:hypothetical protein